VKNNTFLVRGRNLAIAASILLVVICLWWMGDVSGFDAQTSAEYAKGLLGIVFLVWVIYCCSESLPEVDQTLDMDDEQAFWVRTYFVSRHCHKSEEFVVNQLKMLNVAYQRWMGLCYDSADLLVVQRAEGLADMYQILITLFDQYDTIRGTPLRLNGFLEQRSYLERAIRSLETPATMDTGDIDEKYSIFEEHIKQMKESLQHFVAGILEEHVIDFLSEDSSVRVRRSFTTSKKFIAYFAHLFSPEKDECVDALAV